MNGLFMLALVCYGFALIGVGYWLCEWITSHKTINRAVKEFLSTLPMINK